MFENLNEKLATLKEQRRELEQWKALAEKKKAAQVSNIYPSIHTYIHSMEKQTSVFLYKALFMYSIYIELRKKKIDAMCCTYRIK